MSTIDILKEDQAMTRSIAIKALAAASLGLAIAFAPAAFAADDMKKDTMTKDSMSKDKMDKCQGQHVEGQHEKRFDEKRRYEEIKRIRVCGVCPRGPGTSQYVAARSSGGRFRTVMAVALGLAAFVVTCELRSRGASHVVTVDGTGRRTVGIDMQWGARSRRHEKPAAEAETPPPRKVAVKPRELSSPL